MINMGNHQKPAWLDALYSETFFEGCPVHEFAKKNEKNILCLDCCSSLCPHCFTSHRSHRLLQVRRYVYHEVVRLDDLEKLIDCSTIQAYTINSAKVIFIKKRHQNRHLKGCINYCTSCERSLKEPYIHCSLGCKVDFVLKHNKDLSPYLKPCRTLQLGPDFIYPQDIMMSLGDISNNDLSTDYDAPNATTTMTTFTDGDEQQPMSGSSSGSENLSYWCPPNVRKKRSGLCFCLKSDRSKASDEDEEEEDMTNCMINRRKGIPHRSPLC